MGLVGLVINWFIEEVMFLDLVGIVGLLVNVDVVVMSSCVVCVGFIVVCWIIGFSWVNVGKFGSC